MLNVSTYQMHIFVRVIVLVFHSTVQSSEYWENIILLLTSIDLILYKVQENGQDKICLSHFQNP